MPPTQEANPLNFKENEWEFPKARNYNWLRKKKWIRYTSNGEPVKKDNEHPRKANS
jgi:hypothetical protein